MSSGTELLKSIKQVRDFFGELGDLLVTADGLMAEQGWEPIGDAGCVVAGSASVHKGKYLVPSALQRQYSSAERAPNCVAMIAVLLDENKEIEVTISEPLVSGSYFSLLEELADEDPFIQKWQAGWAAWRATADGTPVFVNKDDENWKPKFRFQSMGVFARPLVTLTGPSALKEGIVDPLLELIATRNHLM
jgi:hypothetical protein